MNHFAEAEQLLRQAADSVVPEFKRDWTARAAVHAQLAHVQAIEQAYRLPPAVVDAQVVDDRLAAYGIPSRVPTLETRETTGDRL